MFSLIQQLDGTVLLFLQAHIRLDFLDAPMLFVTRLGDAGLIWIALGLVLSCIPKTRKIGILALTSLLICFLCNNVLLKNLVARPRPYTQLSELVLMVAEQSDWSFPSGHACSSFAVAGSLWWSRPKCPGYLKIPALILATWIAFSRLYVGVHYPSDVLVGIAIGLLGSWLVNRFAAPVYDRAALRLRRH